MSKNEIASSKEEPTGMKIAYIGGGSRGWAHALMKDLARCSYFSGEVALYDIDYPQAEFNARYGNWIQTHPHAVSNWHYTAVKSLPQALKGADFVFMSIMPGPMELMKYDLHIPQKYGIYHAVGDTAGPAGHIRALRSIKIYRGLTEAIAQYAPKAWILNFTNPMTLCTRTIFKTFPEARAFGCCHEVFSVQKMGAELVEK